MRFPFLLLPFVPLAIGLIIVDKLTGGVISGALQKDHDKDVREQFGWKPDERR